MVDSTSNVRKQIPIRLIPEYSKSNLNSNTWTHTFHMTQSNRNDDIDTPSPAKQPVFVIYHQNIQGLKGKTNEIIFSLISCAPNIICLTEHNLNK